MAVGAGRLALVVESVVRVTVLREPLPAQVTGAVEVRRITLQPGTAVGPHRHNGPVFGSIEEGAVVFQVDGGPEEVLHPGDVFYEPAEVVIDRFDALEDGAIFLGYFLSAPGIEPMLTLEG